MVATPIWIIGYGNTPRGGATPVRIVSTGKAPHRPPSGLTEAKIVGYGKPPPTGPTKVWRSSSAGATPVWISGYGAHAGGAPAWTPASLPNLVAWYDAQNAASLIFNSQAVAQWRDQSGHNYTQAQATPANQPIYNATGLNGKPIITFHRSAPHYLTASVPAGAFSNGFSFGVVVTLIPNVNGDGWAWRCVGNLPVVDYNYSGLVVGNGTGSGFNNVVTSWRTMEDNNSYIFTSNIVASPFAYSEWINGTNTVNNHTDGSITYGDPATSLNIGARQDLGCLYEGSLGELVACAGDTDTDRQKLEGYLAWKWGLQAKLPAGHPYTGGPP